MWSQRLGRMGTEKLRRLFDAPAHTISQSLSESYDFFIYFQSLPEVLSLVIHSSNVLNNVSFIVCLPFYVLLLHIHKGVARGHYPSELHTLKS